MAHSYTRFLSRFHSRICIGIFRNFHGSYWCLPTFTHWTPPYLTPLSKYINNLFMNRICYCRYFVIFHIVLLLMKIQMNHIVIWCTLQLIFFIGLRPCCSDYGIPIKFTYNEVFEYCSFCFICIVTLPFSLVYFTWL